MTMIHDGITADVPNDVASAVTGATVPVVVTFSATNNSKKDAVIGFMSRSDAAEYAPTLQTSVKGRYKVSLAAGDDWYVNVVGVDPLNPIDVSVVDAT